MSAIPPQGPVPLPNNQQYTMGAVTRTSGAAITSLVCGILGCIPFITGLIAVLTGIIGISATKSPAVKGRAMAIIGLLLGLISLGGWSLGFTGAYTFYQSLMNGPEAKFADQYIKDITNGNIDAVRNNSTENMQQKLDETIARMKPWGTVTKITAGGLPMTINGQKTDFAAGTCIFSSGQAHSFNLALSKDSAGSLKAESLVWDQGATATTTKSFGR